MVLAVPAGHAVVGSALKAPCAGGDWGDGRQYRRLCYSDIVPLLDTEQLAGGRLPVPRSRALRAPTANCDEYPVLTMYFMRAAAWIWRRRPRRGFFCANAAPAVGLRRRDRHVPVHARRTRALCFALAPTLLIYGFMNWDLLAVAFATAALLAFLARRDGWAGVLLGLGAAAKFYPALLVIPLIAAAPPRPRARRRDPARLGDGRHLARW